MSISVVTRADAMTFIVTLILVVAVKMSFIFIW